MRNETRNLLILLGGRHNDFQQDEFITKNQWDSINPLTRKGAWTYNNYDEKGEVTSYGLEGGVCAGLASCYLIAGSQWTSFTHYIASEAGKSVIRGNHNFQEQLISNCKNGWYHGGIIILDIHKIILKNNDVTHIKSGKVPLNNCYNSLRRDVVSNLNTKIGYLFIINSPTGGHVLGLRVGQGTIHFFDPNLGEFILPYRKANGAAMARFIESFIRNEYPSYNELYVHCFNVR